MQGDGRLAGAGAALDDQDPVGGADDPSCSAWMVCTMSSSGRCVPSRARRAARRRRSGPRGRCARGRRGRGSRRAGSVSVPAVGARCADGGAGPSGCDRWPVEGAGDRGPPVDERSGCARWSSGADADPADVVGVTPTEGAPSPGDSTGARSIRPKQSEPFSVVFSAASSPERSATRTSRFEPGLHGRVALVSSASLDGGLGELPRRASTRVVQPVDEFLLASQFVVGEFCVRSLVRQFRSRPDILCLLNFFATRSP